MWNAGVETHVVQLPALSRTNCLGEGRDIVVGVGVAERLAGGVKQVSGRLRRRLHPCLAVRRSMADWKRITPPQGFSACRAGSKYLTVYYALRAGAIATGSHPPSKSHATLPLRMLTSNVHRPFGPQGVELLIGNRPTRWSVSHGVGRCIRPRPVCQPTQTGLYAPRDLEPCPKGWPAAALDMDSPPPSKAPQPWPARAGAVHASTCAPCPSAGSQSDPELTSCVWHTVSSRHRVRQLCHYVPRTPLVRWWYRALGSFPRVPGEIGGQ